METNERSKPLTPTMNNIEDSVYRQAGRISILKNIKQTKTNLKLTNYFLEECFYCIARCILQDLISIQQREKYDNEIIKSFYTKYKDTRDLCSHFFNSTKKSLPITIEELEDIIKEFHKMIQNKPNVLFIYNDGDVVSTILTKAFKEIYNQKQQPRTHSPGLNK